MSHVTELNVEITISEANPTYVLHHVETIVTEVKLTNKGLGVMIGNEYIFIKDLLGFTPYKVKILGQGVGKTFYRD